MSTDRTKQIVSANDVGELPSAVNGELLDAPPQMAVAPYDPIARTGQYWANWEPTDRADRALIMKAFNKADLSSNDAIGQRFAVHKVLIHTAQVVQEDTGEVIRCTRVVLINPAGETLAFMSEGMLQAISRLCMLEGSGPWTPPINVIVRQVETRRKYRTFSLDILADAPPTEEKSRRK